MFEQKKEGDEDDLEEEVYEPGLTLDDIDDIEWVRHSIWLHSNDTTS